jgi:hypothetical protein
VLRRRVQTKVVEGGGNELGSIHDTNMASSDPNRGLPEIFLH